jgi:hypothetical protein
MVIAAQDTPCRRPCVAATRAHKYPVHHETGEELEVVQQLLQVQVSGKGSSKLSTFARVAARLNGCRALPAVRYRKHNSGSKSVRIRGQANCQATQNERKAGAAHVAHSPAISKTAMVSSHMNSRKLSRLQSRTVLHRRPNERGQTTTHDTYFANRVCVTTSAGQHRDCAARCGRNATVGRREAVHTSRAIAKQHSHPPETTRHCIAPS